MSYEIGIIAEMKNGRLFQVADTNITSNLNRMFYEAGLSLDALNGLATQEAAMIVEPALGRIREEPEHFRQFNAPNCWGKQEDAVRFLGELLGLCNDFPDCKLEVQG